MLLACETSCAQRSCAQSLPGLSTLYVDLLSWLDSTRIERCLCTYPRSSARHRSRLSGRYLGMYSTPGPLDAVVQLLASSWCASPFVCAFDRSLLSKYYSTMDTKGCQHLKHHSFNIGSIPRCNLPAAAPVTPAATVDTVHAVTTAANVSHLQPQRTVRQGRNPHCQPTAQPTARNPIPPTSRGMRHACCPASMPWVLPLLACRAWCLV